MEDIFRKKFKTVWKQIELLCKIKKISSTKYQEVYDGMLKKWSETMTNYKSGTGEFELYTSKESRDKILSNVLTKYITKLEQEYESILNKFTEQPGGPYYQQQHQPKIVHIYELPPNIHAIYRTK